METDETKSQKGGETWWSTNRIWEISVRRCIVNHYRSQRFSRIYPCTYYTIRVHIVYVIPGSVTGPCCTVRGDTPRAAGHSAVRRTGGSASPPSQRAINTRYGSTASNIVSRKGGNQLSLSSSTSADRRADGPRTGRRRCHRREQNGYC